MRRVTPQAVAYAAAQVRRLLQFICLVMLISFKIYVSLSSLQHWGRHDGFFDIELFYESCVSLFTADPDYPWALETLAFLTE